MNIILPHGITTNRQYVVTELDTAEVFHSGEVNVLATPRLLAMIEETTFLSVKDFLPKGYITVGVEAKISHMHSSKIGTHISIRTKLQKQEGRKLFFEAIVEDHSQQIAQCTCVRFIVDKQKFINKD